MMKRILTILCVALLTASVLCACGGKQQTSVEMAHQCDGKWKCTEIPIGMQVNEIWLDIDDGVFAYTLKTNDLDTIIEGTAKSTGNTSMVLYMNNQKQVNSSDQQVVKESRAQQSEIDAQPVYIQINDDGTLTVEGNSLKMKFQRSR